MPSSLSALRFFPSENKRFRTFAAFCFVLIVSHSAPPSLMFLPFLTCAAICFSDFSPTSSFFLLFMDPPPTGLLAGSMAPPPREAVFNPYRLPVSPPPGNIRPQPHRQPELLWLHWMVCLAAWTAEALCAHPIMAQEVPPDQHFESRSFSPSICCTFSGHDHHLRHLSCQPQRFHSGLGHSRGQFCPWHRR